MSAGWPQHVLPIQSSAIFLREHNMQERVKVVPFPSGNIICKKDKPFKRVFLFFIINKSSHLKIKII